MKNIEQHIEKLLATLPDILIQYGPKLLGALIIIIIGRLLASLFLRILNNALKRTHFETSLRKFLVSLTNVISQIIIYLTALRSLGVGTTSIIALLGAAGLAVGLALKDTLSNFAAGVMIVWLRYFRVGDLIEGDGVQGIVQEIGIFTTTLNTIDNKRVMIPNNNIFSKHIINYTINGIRRLDLTIGVDYNTDIHKAKAIFEDILATHPQILKEPIGQVLLLNLAESSIEFAVRPWVDATQYPIARSEILATIKERLEQAGISIPYPHREVHVYHKN